MFQTNTVQLNYLLSSYFIQLSRGKIPTDLENHLNAIKTIDDLVTIDGDFNDPLWHVVPQIIMYRFGLAAFQEFETRYSVRKSFVFIHPAHGHIVPQLEKELSQQWTVGKPIIRELNNHLICCLYGGYMWHSAYAAACAYRGDLGLSATILPLLNCTPAELQELISYKNKKRDQLSKKIVIPKELLGQPMHGVIQAFHCPDVLENVRQMLNLGLVDFSEVVDDHAHHWRS